MKSITRDPTEDKRRFQTGNVFALSICHFVHDIYSGFLPPLLPLIIEKLSISLTQAGFLSTVMQIPSLMNPFIGALADRISVRHFVILAPIMTAVPMSLIGLAPSYGVLLTLLFVTGISVSVFHVPSPVMIYRLSGSKAGKGMSFYMTGGELARTVAPLAAVGAVSVFGLEGFYPVMVFAFFSSGWLYVRFRGISLQGAPAQGISVLRTWNQMRHILIPLIVILFSRGFMHASLTMFLPTYIEIETGNLWLAGAGLTFFEAAGVAGIMLSGPLSDYFGRKRVLFASLVGGPASLFMFTGMSGWIGYAALFLTGFTLLSTSPVMLALVQENAKGSPSAANGIFMAASFIGRSAIVVIVGMIGDYLGLRTTYFISAALGLIGIPFIFMLPGR